MAQIADVMHALVVFDAARQELAWAYSGNFTSTPEPLKGAVQTISEVLNEAEARWVRVTSTTSTSSSTFREKAKAVVVPVVVGGTVDEEGTEAVVVEELGDTQSSTGEVGSGSQSITIREWLMRIKDVAYDDMRAVAKKELLRDCSRIDDKLSPGPGWFPCIPRTTRTSTTITSPTIDAVARKLEELKKQYESFGFTTTGLPLATSGCTERPCVGRQEDTTVAHVLAVVGRRDDHEWPGVIRDNLHIWNISGGFSRDSQLPLHSIAVLTHLKRSRGVGLRAESWLSFAYCAFVFPKGKEHQSMAGARAYCDLLNQWCSLGITTRRRGASCILELFDHLLLREKHSSSTARTAAKEAWESAERIRRTKEPPAQEYSGRQRARLAWEGRLPVLPRRMERPVPADTMLVTMDGFMHDFARYVLGDRLVVVDGKDGAAPPSPAVNKSSNNNAYLALVRNLDATKPLDVVASELPDGILALRFEECSGLEVSDDSDFACGKYSHLRLLDLSGCSVKKLPPSIAHLKQLRYLSAPGIQDERFPRPIITGLQELRCLNLSGSCPLSDLTEAFELLRNLSHLHLSGCSGLQALPDSFGRLWRLQHLDLSACSGLEALPESFCWLRDLTHLDLSGCSRLKALPGSFDYSALSHIDISGCSGLTTLPESFSNIGAGRRLNLSGCSGLETLPADAFGDFCELEHLNLSSCSGLQALPESLCRLGRLRHLDLSGCSGLKQLPDAERWNQHLEHLDLSGCSSLADLPFRSPPERLQYLDLSGCLSLQMSEHYSEIIGLVNEIRSKRNGRASGPEDDSLSKPTDQQSAPKPEIGDENLLNAGLP